MWSASLSVCVCVVFGISGSVDSQGTTASRHFKNLTRDYWAWRHEDSPEFATRVNVNVYNNKTERYDIQVLTERNETVDKFLEDLHTIKRDELTAGERNSYDVLSDTLSIYAAGYKWRDYGPMNPVNFLEGLWNSPNEFIPTTFQTYKDFDDYAQRISGWATQVDSLIERMNKSIEMNTTNHIVSMTDVAGEIDSFMGDSEMDCPIYKPFNETLDNATISDSNKTRLNASALSSMRKLRVALKKLKDFVTEVFMNNTREEFGVGSFRDGADYYKACLKWHLSIDMEPEDIHSLGLAEVERISKQMQIVLDRQKFQGSLRDFFDFLNSNSSLLPESPEDVITKYEDIINKRVGPKLKNLFRDVPNMPVKVQAMPSDGPGGSYQFGSPDGTRPGVFYANTFRPKDSPTYTMVSLALHEADPGHHMQDIFSQSAVGLPDFRKVVDDSKYFSAPLHFPIYTAYLEGWALYSESLGEAEYLDVYNDDFELMGRYSDEIFRACRLVVDTGLHYYGWSREKAIQYMMNFTTGSRESLSIEINRYITWPGQACAYKIGELKIKDLRRYSMVMLGKQFDIKDFHAVVLENGAVPLNVLENLVTDWIQNKRQSIRDEFLKKSLTFQELADDYWQWRLEDAPEFASSLQLKKYSSKAEQYNLEGLTVRKESVDDYLTKLRAIDRETLADADRVSYEVLMDTLVTFSQGFAWKNYGTMNPVNFLEGILTDPGFYGPMDPVKYDDFNNYIERLHGYIGQVDDFITRMHVAFEEKTTSNWVSMNRTLEPFETFAKTPPQETDLLKPFITALNTSALSSANKSMLTSKAVTTMRQLQLKYLDLKKFIENEYKPNSRQTYGVNSFENGTEYYQACLKWHLSTDKTPEEIHELGLSEVLRIHAEMVKVTQRLNFNGTTAEFFKSLNNDPRFFLNSSQEVLERFTTIIRDRVRPKLGKYFKNIPDMPVVVKEMPYDGPGGSYSFGTPDGSKPGTFYVNVVRPKDNPTCDMIALTLHEADPGHHLQDIYAQASKSMPVFRRVSDYTKYFAVPAHFPFYTAYTEGWALYAESLGEKEHLDIYADDYELMGRYSSEIFRACRLVVDTGIHHFNWTRESAIQYMLNYTSYSRGAMEVEIDRYITWPGQACAYKVGELKIKELRGKAERILGDDFDIRDFHSVLLDSGSVPLDVLEQLVNDWIADVQDTFEKISYDFFEMRKRDSPEFASSVSYTYNDRLTSYKYEEFDLQKAEALSLEKRLKKIQRDSLPHETQVSFDILKDILSTFLDGYQWKDYGALNPINFLDGWHVDFGYLPSSMPFDTQGDFINYVRRVELLSVQYGEMVNLTKKAIEDGHTSHNASLLRVLGQLHEFTSKNITESALYKPFTEFAKALFGTGPELVHVHTRFTKSLNQLKDVLTKVATFMSDEYIPKSRQGLGIGTLPNGSEQYKACLKWHTSLGNTPEEVHTIGRQEVARIEIRIKESMANLSLNSSWTIAELYQHLRSDEQFLITDPEKTLGYFRDIIFQRIKPKIKDYFTHAPMLPLLVKASASDGIGGQYMSMSEDGSRPGIFYANVHRPAYNPTFKMISLSLHEAIPGHHLAESYTHVSDLPSFRKNMEWRSYSVPYFYPFYNAYVEGWALYAEYLGEEMGIYENHYELLGRFGDEMHRACRLVVDTGIHYKNWTREDAIAYMLNYTALTPESAAVEVDRYATWPGQACGYKMGEMKIREMRKKAEDELGDRFSLGDFHNTVLKNGPMPLSVLAGVVDEWIQSVKSSHVIEVKFSTAATDISAATSPVMFKWLMHLTAVVLMLVKI